MQSQKVQVLAEEKQHHHENIQDLIAEKNALTKMNAQLLQAQKELTQAFDTTSRESREIGKEKEAISKRLENLGAENAALAEAVEDLKGQVASAHESRQVTADKEARLLRSSRDELEAKVAKLTSQSGDVEAAKREARALEEKNAALKEQLSQLEGQMLVLAHKTQNFSSESADKSNLRKAAREVNYLKQKTIREAGFRADLIFQKGYLLELLASATEGHHAPQDRSFLLRSPPTNDYTAYRSPTKESPLARFKRAAVAVLAVTRMKTLQSSWKKTRTARREVFSAPPTKPAVRMIVESPVKPHSSSHVKSKELEKVLEETQAGVLRLKLETSAFLNKASQKIEDLKRK